MFIAQVMHAEGLAKILNTILRVRKQGSLNEIRREIEILESVAMELAGLPDSSAMTAVQKQLDKARLATEQHAADIALLKRCGIRPEEYEKKFQNISLDCLRISHGSVKPPQWEVA